MRPSKTHICPRGGTFDKIIRYTIPFFIAWVIELTAFYVLEYRDAFSVLELLKEFLCGGIGPGSYYFPILIQLVFLFPVIYRIVSKYEKQGLVICCIANILYELLQWAYGMSEDTYRLLIFRYILYISFGCYFGLEKRISKCCGIILFVVGVFSSILSSYYNCTLFFVTHWQSTSFLTALHAVPIFCVLKEIKISIKPLEILGKASYHIFLVQMVFYNFAVFASITNTMLNYAVCMLTCFVFGTLFYFFEQPITKFVIAFIHKQADKVKLSLQ